MLESEKPKLCKSLKTFTCACLFNANSFLGSTQSNSLFKFANANVFLSVIFDLAGYKQFGLYVSVLKTISSHPFSEEGTK
jgi:hypothetical protein